MKEQDKISKIVSFFPKPKGDIRINAPGEEPTSTKIAIFQDYVEQCAMTIPFDDNELGLAGIIMTESDYKGINNGNRFDPPARPGIKPRPSGVAAGTEPSTAQVMRHQQKIEDWKKDKQLWAEYKAGEQAIRNLIIDNVDDEYISELKHKKTQYKQIPPFDLMEHLKNCYGNVDDKAITAMRMEMLQYNWHPPTPITTMFSKFSELKKTSDLAQHGIKAHELVSAAIVIIRNTGLFNTECDEWEKKKSYDWAAFQKFFIKESIKVKKHTSAQLGYSETAAAVLELAEDLNSVKEILQSTRQTETVNALTANEIKDLICQEVNAAAANNSPPSTPATQAKVFKKVQGVEAYTDLGQVIFYCHTHGVTFSKNHRSATCSNKGINHDDSATLWNRKGGSDKFYDKRKKKT